MRRAAERILKFLLPVLIVTEIILVWADILKPRDAVLVLAGIETLLLLISARQIFAATRNYRRGRAAGLDPWAAFEDGLTVLLPRRVAKIVALEPRLWVCLVRWALRRVKLREGEFGYHRRSPTLMLAALVLLVSPAEIALFHVLLRAFVGWTWLEVLVFVVELYAAFWIVGIHASIVVTPHRLERDGVLLRYGAFARAFVPYSEIQSVKRERGEIPKHKKRMQGLRIIPDEHAAYFAISRKTDILVRLKNARPMEGLLGETPAVTDVRFAADEPEEMTRQLRRRVESASVEMISAG